MPFTDPKQWVEPPNLPEPNVHDAAMKYLSRELPPDVAEQVRVDHLGWPVQVRRRTEDGELYIYESEPDQPLPPEAPLPTQSIVFHHDPFEYPANVWWLMSFSIEHMRLVVIGPLDERWPPRPPHYPPAP